MVLMTSLVTHAAGGRVTGKDVIAELVVELRASVQQAEQFEGEMRNLAAYARALAQALDCIRSAGGSRCISPLFMSHHTQICPATSCHTATEWSHRPSHACKP